MASPRWNKVRADLTMSWTRTLLVILSIAIGVFAVGTMLTARVVLNAGVDRGFETANPASAVLVTEPFDDRIVAEVGALPQIAAAEGRATVTARLRTADGSWRNLVLTALPDFRSVAIDTVLPDTGAWPPATGHVLIERASLGDAGITVGDRITIETPDGVRHTLPVSGTAYDPGQVSPALGGDSIAGYIALDTLAALGRPVAFDHLHIVAADNPRDLEQGERVAGLVRDRILEPAGIDVHRIQVHDTPRYHSTDLGNALLLVLGLMGVLILLLAVFLVINTVNALLAQQVRQIGLMKAIGGRRRQIALLYVALVLAYGAVAATIAIPLAAVATRFFTGYLADMLNIDVTGPWFPVPVVAVEVGLALVVPLIAALVPVNRGTTIPVREAITSYGIGQRTGGAVDRFIARLRWLPRPVVLSLGNTFRRRGRLVLTLVTLTLGGALFAGVTTVNASLNATLDEVIDYFGYDAELNLESMRPADTAVAQAAAVPGVAGAEGWIVTNASRVRPDGTQNSNVWLMAPPAGSAHVRPTLVEGRWFTPDDRDALVINVDLRNDTSSVALGDEVTLWVEGHRVQWPVIGIVSSQMMGPVAFAPHGPLSRAIGMPGQANRIVLGTHAHDAATQEQVAQAAQRSLQAEGFPVTEIFTRSERVQNTQAIFDVLVLLLLVIGGLLVIVGALGLTGAMLLNVIERTREIGVMRAIGASNRSIAGIVITEGLTIGVISWLLSVIVALPLSWLLSNAIGVAFLQQPLAFTFSFAGLVIWLALVVVLSVVASVLPARRAWRLSVRDVLAYE